MKMGSYVLAAALVYLGKFISIPLASLYVANCLSHSPHHTLFKVSRSLSQASLI